MAERATDEKKNPETDKDIENLERNEFSKDDKNSDDGTMVEVASIPDCPVCLQACSYPVKLTCGHIFCFLCIKGVAFRSKRCALCRHDVDLKYFENPVVVNFPQKRTGESTLDETDRYQWYYEGRNGWWQYEESSSAELEKAHKENKRSCELQIAGFLYFIDFENMVQFRKNEPGRRRRIKRDLVDAEKKGVAGLRLQTTRRSAEVVRPEMAAESSTRDLSCPINPDRLQTDVPDVPSIERLVIGSSSSDASPVQQNGNTDC